MLYHVTSTFDTANNTLVNTGDQVFSGTIAGSDPVMIHDGRFSFHENLKTGADTGSVYLFDHIAGPECSARYRSWERVKTPRRILRSTTPADVISTISSD